MVKYIFIINYELGSQEGPIERILLTVQYFLVLYDEHLHNFFKDLGTYFKSL